MEATAKKTGRKNFQTQKSDKFIDKILENLSAVKVSDWEMYANISEIYPTNLFSKKKYQGFNILALYIDTICKGFKSSKYATFNSIAKAGGRLKKGSKGCVIEFFSFIYKDKETGNTIPSATLKLMSSEELLKLVKIPIIRNYVVFNSEQIENLEEMNLDIDLEEEEEHEEIQDIANCENFISKIINNGNLRLRFGISQTAFYSPSLDYVQLPKKEFFISASKYYCTLFHEIIHWTGHEKRLKRELKGKDDKQSYSFEELIAEMGAMLLCLQFGILDEFINSVRYLKSWLSVNSENKESQLRKAFIESKRAKKYLENL